MNDRVRAVALGNDPADLLLRNGRVVDVLTETVYEADIAARELVRVQGGYTLVEKGSVVGTVPLNICGLMSSEVPEKLIDSLEKIQKLAHHQGVPSGIDPFILLSFMALPVIPRLRITDMGMFDAEHFQFIK